MGFSNIFRAFEELYMDDKEAKNPCQVCGTPDSKKPMCFQGEAWCCENHRKQVLGDSPQKRH